MDLFKLVSPFDPCGDQPQAIAHLTQGILSQRKSQVLLGITGSGKTFTMANVIQNVQRPTLVLAHNKTLAAQLYQELRSFFPHNAVEYFVSYYDYYQPEAYIARTDTYIEKDLAINEKIEKMRLSATRSILQRRDVIIVASVSCIYGLGSPEYYRSMNLTFEKGQNHPRESVLLHLVDIHYKRNDWDFSRGTFRVRGEVLDIFPAYEEDVAFRIEYCGDEVESIFEFDPLTGKKRKQVEQVSIYPGSHYVTPELVRLRALESIKEELQERMQQLEKEGKWVEMQRIHQRTSYDLEMIREVGFCKGIENYSRHFSGRKPGEAPPCLLDYFPSDYLLFIDESHQTVPQMHAMCNGDKARKTALVEFGFRLISAYDNRPLSFHEAHERFNQVIYVSATPSAFEIQDAQGEIVQQIIRPTGLLDPVITLRPASMQVDDCLAEIHLEIKQGGKVLVTTLTKRLAEELTRYLTELGIKAKYLHSDVDTIERVQIIHDLRKGLFDVLVGINLLREGLDIPEVCLVVILDADKEGFLRSETALVQTCGRAARNSKGRVLMYADKTTSAISNTLKITHSRRELQQRYNAQHGIVPKTVHKEAVLLPVMMNQEKSSDKKASHSLMKDQATLLPFDLQEVQARIKHLDKEMKKAAKELRFEEAARLRDQMRGYQEMELQWE